MICWWPNPETRWPTIDKRTAPDGTITYRVRVRKLGHPTRTKTFSRKTDAAVWARQLESRIDKGSPFRTKPRPDERSVRRLTVILPG